MKIRSWRRTERGGTPALLLAAALLLASGCALRGSLEGPPPALGEASQAGKPALQGEASQAGKPALPRNQEPGTRNQEPETRNQKPTAQHPNGGFAAQWSPDGARLAFLSQRPGEPANLWVAAADGRGPRALTDRGARAFRWAADGQALYAFTWYGGELGWFRLPLAGGAPAPAWPWLPEHALEPTPSPDGAHLAYVLPGARSHDLWLARADGSRPVNVISEFFARKPVWSPDGRQLAFEIANTEIDWQSQVWIYHRETRRLAHLRGAGTLLHSWSPDGKQLAISRAMPPSDNYRLGIAAVATGEPLDLPTLLHTGEGVAWSPDGRLLAVTERDGERSRVALVRPDGTVTRRIGGGRLLARFPRWSSDGRRLLFEGMPEGRGYGSEVWTARADRDHTEALVAAQPSDWLPTVSPDGRRVAFLSTRGGGSALWVADASGAGATRVTDAEPEARLVWSPDGDALLLLQPRGSAVARFASRPVARPLAIEPVLPHAAWAPDGRSIAFTALVNGRRTLLLADPDGEPRPLLPSVAPGAAGDAFPAWDAAGRELAFLRGAELWRARADGSRAQRWALLGHREDLEVTDLRWFPDRREALVTLLDFTRDAAAWELRAVAANGRSRTLVSEPVRSDFAARRDSFTGPPAWLPDGGILYTADRAAGPQAWRVNAEGRQSRELSGWNATYPAPLPDGRLLFVAPEGGGARIWSAAPASGAARPWSNGR